MNKKLTFILPIAAIAMTIGVAAFANVPSLGAIFADNETPAGCGDIVYGKTRYSSNGSAANTSAFSQSNTNVKISSVSVSKAYSGNTETSKTYTLKVGTNSSTGSITYNFEENVLVTRIMIYACPFSTGYTSPFSVTTTGHGTSSWDETAASYAAAADFNPEVLYDSGTFFASDKTASSSFTISTTGTSYNALSIYKIVLRVKGGSPEPEPETWKGHDLMVQVNEILATKYCDSIYLKYGDWDCLIDGGNYADKATISTALNTYCTDHKLDLYIGTHSHDDHMGMFRYGTATNNVFKDGGITSFGYVIDNGSARTTVAFYKSYVENIRPWMVENGATYIPSHAFFNSDSGYESYQGKNVINITGDAENTSSLGNAPTGNVYLTIMNSGFYLTPGDAESSGSPNERSIGVVFAAYNQRYIMCGDAEGTTEEGFMSNHSGLDGKPNLWNDDNDVYLKANHHCSNTEGSNGQTWIDWVNPDHVFISAAISKDSTIGDNSTSEGVTHIQHPYPAAIKRFETKTYDIHWNGINGTYRYKNTNGGAIDPTFEGSAKQVSYYHDGQIVTGEETTTFPMSKWCLSSIWSDCAKSSSTGHDRKPKANVLGSFTNFNYDYDSFIERNAKDNQEITNELGELYDSMNGSYC